MSGPAKAATGWRRRGAWALIILGTLLVALPTAYFGYAAIARARVHDLDASLSPDQYKDWVAQIPSGTPSPTATTAEPAAPPATAPAAATPTPGAPENTPPLKVGDYSHDGYADHSVPLEVAGRRLPNGMTMRQLLDLIGSADLMIEGPPAEVEASPTPTPTPVPLPKEEVLPDNGVASLGKTQPSIGADNTLARRMRIPSISVDAPVKIIRQTIEEGKLVWERPNRVVGQLDGTPNPGVGGNTVMAGHLESPVRGEGNVFENLPDIKLLDSVYVETERARYEYRVVQKRVVLPNDLDAVYAEGPTLTLMTCVPKGVYSHRLIVSAKLYKIEQLPAATATPGGQSTP